MTQMQRTTMGHVGAMPASTWHFLKMNDASVEIPEGLEIAPAVKASVSESAIGSDGDFEAAFAQAQRRWEEAHPAPTAQELAERVAYMAAEADATYGGTALSEYQAGADAVERARSLAAAFDHGMGEDAAGFLRSAAGNRIVVNAQAGQQVDAQVSLLVEPETLSVAAVDVVAGRNSNVKLSIVVESNDGSASENQVAAGFGDCTGISKEADAAEEPKGVAGTTVRVFADDGATVDIVRMQVLDDDYVDMDDMGLFASEGAHLSVTQTVLGAGQSFTGLAADLRGRASRLDIGTRYLGRDSQARDFNYIVRHHGPASECDLAANGILAGTSSKTLRGTIDFVHGAKGAQGSENETVLLVDEGVRNKTVPIILCNEDDVAGNHGATIGHVRDDQLFYLASRGLSQEAAERMFVGAIVEQAVLDAPTDALREGALRFGERLSAGFAQLFDEGE